MAKYSTAFDETQAEVLRKLSRTLDGYESLLKSAANAMDTRDATMSRLASSVRADASAIPGLSSKIKAAGDALTYSVAEYNRAEKDAKTAFLGGAFAVGEHLRDMFPALFAAGATVNDAIAMIFNLGAWKETLSQVLPWVSQDGWELEVTQSMEREFDNFVKEWGNKNDNVPDIKTFATLISAQIKKEVSMLEKSARGEFDYGYGEVSAKVGTAEAHAGISAGIFSISEDGKKIFAPGVSAQIGASVTALSLAASGVLGSDDLGLYGKASVDVGKVAAGGNLNVGFFTDENGKLDVKAKASLSAEAVLFEAEGSAGVTIFGAEVGVSAGVKVGVGANFDVGYQDGKISCQIGASLGLGFELGFEVDVGGIVSGVANAAKSAWNGFLGLFK